MSARPAGVYRFSLPPSTLAVVAVGMAVAAAALFAGGVVLGLELALAGRAEPATGAVERLTAGAVAAARARAAARPPGREPAVAEPVTVADTAVAAAPTAKPRAGARPAPPRFDPVTLRLAAGDGPQPPPGLRPGGPQRVPEVPYGRAIYRIARRYAVNPDVVAALVWAESAFDPLAQSSRGARGLMQVMPATGDRFGIEPELLWEPEANLVAGVRYLSWLGERFEDDLTLVLAAYNAGEAAVDSYGGVPPFQETRTYVGKILRSLGGEATPALGDEAAR